MLTGRVIRPGIDPQWLDTDLGYALAWQANQRATCSCGTRPDEWEDDRDAYVPDIHFCRGHQVLDQARRDVPKDRDGHPAPGFFPHLRPRTPEDDEPLDDD